MLCLRALRRWEPVLCRYENTGVRSFATAACDAGRPEDAVVSMENPYQEPQKGCTLCGVAVDYKNMQLLSQFISPHTGRIYGRHITGLCGRKQKQVSKAIKKAQSMGFMSVTHKHPEFMKDPKICGVRHLD